MPTYHQISRQVSWALLFITPLLAFIIFFTIGFVSVFVGFIQHLMVPEKTWQVARALWMGAAVMVPAISLSRFYYVIAARLPSRRYAKIGWGASAAYHAALTWIFIVPLPGTIQTSGSPLHLPLALFSGAGLCFSFYLFLRYPSPPALPAAHLDNGG